MDLGPMLAGPALNPNESLLAELFKDAQSLPGAVLAIEHVEQALAATTRGIFLLRQALDRGTRVVGTTLPDSLSFFDAVPLRRLVDSCGYLRLASMKHRKYSLLHGTGSLSTIEFA
jgi:hypothetical protein